MALYHKWGVKTDFTFALQFFMLISDGLGGVNSMLSVIQFDTIFRFFIIQTHLKVVCSSRQRTFLAFSASLAVEPSKKTVSEGAFGFFEILMISFSLGTPRVTFLEDTPAKWKVFSVIWVAGSPIDWAAIAPTISPGVA
jgi:hypothetical protein